MKFSCTQENLQHGVSLVSHITSRNVNLPILNNVLIEAKEDGVELVATNLEIGVRVTVRGKVETPGSFTVPAQVFANYIGVIAAEKVDVEQQDVDLHIRAGKQNTKIKGEQATEFPLIPDVDEKNAVTIPANELRTALSQVLVATSTDDSRPELTGALFQIGKKEIVVASTDSYRLAERKIVTFEDGAEGKTVIVPAAAMQELVRIFFSDSQAKFVTEDAELTTRLIEGVFPDYQQIIPQESRTTVIVNREKLKKGIKAASLFSKSGIHDVNIHFSPEKQELTLTAVNNQVGENVTKVEAEINGESNNTIFNHRYLLDGLSQVTSEKAQLRLVDNASPGVLRPHGENAEEYIYIIMPIKQ